MEGDRSSGSFALGRQIVSCRYILAVALGYGLFRGANTLLYSSALVSFPFPSLFISNMTLSFATGLAASLFSLACALLAWRGALSEFKLPVLVPAGILAVVGIPVALLAVIPAPSPVFITLALCYGAASMCMNLAWIELLAHQKLSRIAAAFALGMLLKGLITLLLEGLGGWALIVAITALVAVSAGLLVAARKRSWIDKESLKTAPMTMAVYRRGLVGVADAVVVSIVLEATVSILSGFFFGAKAGPMSGFYSLLGTFVAAAIFCVVTVFVARMTDIERLYRYLFPVLLVLVVVLPLLQGEGPSALLQGMLVLIYDFISFSALYFVLRQLRSSGLSTYVLGGTVTALIRTSQLVFGAIGYVLGVPSCFGDSSLYWVVVIAVVYGLSMLLLFLSRRRPRFLKEQVVVMSAEDRFARRAQELKGECRLTPRETEIMLHLARGRSAAVIAEELVCSPATVRTHTKSIYAKLGVHSKQELIDLFGV